MSRTNLDMYEKLGNWESGDKNKPNHKGDYKAKNELRYLGKYQMGTAALADAGYYKPSGKDDIRKNLWNGTFTGKDDTYSVNDYLNNPQAQENAVRKYHQEKWKQLKGAIKEQTNKDISDFLGKTINGVPITPSGLLIAGHLGGQGRVAAYLKCNGKPKTVEMSKYLFDGNGTHIEEYMGAFADYNVSDITGIPHKAYGLNANMEKDIKKYEKEIKDFQAQKTGWGFQNIENQINKMNEKNEQFANQTNKYYDDLESYVINKYADCKSKGGNKNAPQYVKNITFEQFKKQNEEQQQNKNKINSVSGASTGFAAHVNHSSTDPFIQGFDGEPKDTRTPSKKVADEIDNDKWDDNDIAFLEGFNEKEHDNHLIKEAKERRKNKAKQKGNKGKGPNGEDGYWCGFCVA